jgi:predicted HAD superfamily hydrolase
MNSIRNSFDVFDTCLIRLWADPSDLFILLGQRLQQMAIVRLDDNGFSEHRRSAELDAWKQNGFIKQPSLHQIFHILARNLMWTKEEAELALEKEIELEIEGIMPAAEVLSLINCIHSSGENVVYISDMYLPEKVIYEMLLKCGFWQEGDRLFVSVDSGLRKHNGLLFRHVRKVLKQPIFSIQHTGDNYRSDFIMAWISGFRGKHFQSGLLHRREKEGLKSIQSSLFGSKFAALSRMNRLSYDGLAKYKSVWDTVAAGFAPMVFSFAYHCLIKAMEKGITNLYFCSRDGQLPMKIAKIMNEAYHFGFNIQYLRCSRSAWCKTDLTGSNPRGLAIALEMNKKTTINNIIERLGLDNNYSEEIQNYLGEKIALDAPLSKKQKAFLIQGFASGFIHGYLCEVEEKNRVLCINYFTECGIDFKNDFLLIDAMSRGTMEHLFKRTVEKSGHTAGHINWIYWEFINEKRSSNNSFIVSDRNMFPFSRAALVEALLATNEPPLISYKFSEYGVSLVEGKNENSTDENLLHETVHQSCVNFAKLVCENINLEEIDKKKIDLYAFNAFDSLLSNPTRREAECLKSLPFNFWHESAPIAKRPGFKDYAKIIVFALKGKTDQVILDGPWMEGSIALANSVSRFMLKLILRIK